ncbi:class I SAM-dependent methyltransferase [Mycobacterium shimoidei]|uniref:S-adenosyl-L-methionine-dependent methyltransferase n=1 Tax=Mycobacterium shimoidei TaxID=29313 RepID=A0A375YW47_MYCSH|nr:class I SAM-dependent methyltransferase [Mycobacterium shimoidei]MCV7260819.1 class I SAM-dependent methyltransferase [Mycobacterium shimoidei]SRX93067.1 putative S-adenosylmethionine-dependent methyltransferase [Mycobacterium tuberculosis H37Rv] [Mycobacterium shimoidei]
MPRTDNDSWDITESVGSTALGVAAARAAETASENPLIRDPFARMFVDAAGDGTWRVFTDPALRAQLLDTDPELQSRLQVMVDFMAVRTAFFDEFFLNAASSGVRQVVILAAGLDARAWRLPWPDGTTVYELDQAKVLDFKSATLRQSGARPTSRLVVNVSVDLRQDWPTALQEGGFDVSRPTAWSAEGLIRYLPAWAQDLLFERIDALSPAGSRLAVNAPAKNFLDPGLLARQRELTGRYRAAAAKLVGTEVPDTEDLWYREERTDVAQWLGEHGWEVATTTMAEMLGRYGRSIPDEGVMPPTDFIAAQR